MALEGTHIRFALDVQEDFAVEQKDTYLAGSVYPDSRYPTGTDRMLTHDDSQMKPNFWEGYDFRKGWAAHLLYDEIQYSVHTELFSDILKARNPDMSGEDDWVVRSALKILQDLEDISQFPITEHIDALHHLETPNGEDEAVMRRYNQSLIELYSNTLPVTVEDHERMWVGWTVPEEIAKKMRDKALEIRADDQLMSKVMRMYDETMSRKDDFFNRFCR